MLGLWLEMVIQICRVQVQREREKLKMTPKMRGALEALKKMQHHADYEAEKLTKRIEGETMPALVDGFKVAHSNVDACTASWMRSRISRRNSRTATVATLWKAPRGIPKTRRVAARLQANDCDHTHGDIYQDALQGVCRR
jgi:hypothetical protein